MKTIKVILIFSAFLIAISCSSVNLPKVEDSEKKIQELNLKLDGLEKDIKSKNIVLPAGNDLILKVSGTSLNRVLEKFSNQRNDDIILDFWKTPSIYKEDVNILGIKYTNYVDIDGGKISLDLKKLRFDNLHNNRIDGVLEIEGRGDVSVSGKYTGIPASATPNLQLSLNDVVSFDVSSSPKGELILKAIPKTINLKTRTAIKLLKWDLPWNQDIPLELSQIIQPLTIPLALESEIQFPLPAQKFGNNKLEYAPYKLKLIGSKITTSNNKLDYRTNIDFIKK
jgi:hypothetical protein